MRQKRLLQNMRYINLILLCGIFVINIENADLIAGKEVRYLENADTIMEIEADTFSSQGQPGGDINSNQESLNNASSNIVLNENASSDIAIEDDTGSNVVMEVEESSDITLPIEDVRPKIALTFDDGPHPIYTEKLLDGLKERGVKATFFLIGSNIEGNEELVKRMYDEGHLIGNHTYNHVEIKSLSDKAACEQLLKTNELILDITGENAQYVRPPFGVWKSSLDCGIPMFMVLWTVDPLDWTTSSVSQVVNKVVTKTKENDIILLHDCYGSSVEAALEIIDQLQSEGYDFVTVDELILE